MKTTVAFSLAIASASAFPKAMYEMADVVARQAVNRPQGGAPLPLVPPPFDAKSQYVSNKGAYAVSRRSTKACLNQTDPVQFVAPGPSDERGPCPGLNALANHGYLPHNGRATIAQFVSATNAGFGMSADLATFLAVYGAIVDGDGTSWSIAGAPHIGIGGSHGNYETDSSPIRGDLYQYGSNTKLQLSQFKTLYNMQPNAATANYNLDVLRAFRVKRFQESIDKNPYFSCKFPIVSSLQCT